MALMRGNTAPAACIQHCRMSAVGHVPRQLTHSTLLAAEVTHWIQTPAAAAPGVLVYGLAPSHGCCWVTDTSVLAEPPTFVSIHPVSRVYRHTSDGDGHV